MAKLKHIGKGLVQFIQSVRWSLIVGILTFIAVQVAPHFAGFIEVWYSETLYPMIAVVLSGFSSLFSFSLDDCFYGLLIILFLGALLLTVIRRLSFLSFLRLLIRMVCWLYVAFYWLWGFNYFRENLNNRLNIAHSPTSEDVLVKIVKSTISEANSLVLKRDSMAKDQVDSVVEYTYHRLSPFLKLSYPGGIRRPKTITFSRFFAKGGISGYYGPFFNEVHVNSYLLSNEYPFVLSHEKSHQFGVSSEAEANFYAWFICHYSGNAELMYSADLSILPYLINALHSKEQARKLVKTISPRVLDDLRKIRMHWMKLRSVKVEHYASRVNDAYLKTNKVTKGIQDYRGVVGFIIDFKKDLTAVNAVEKRIR